MIRYFLIFLFAIFSMSLFPIQDANSKKILKISKNSNVDLSETVKYELAFIANKMGVKEPLLLTKKGEDVLITTENEEGASCVIKIERAVMQSISCSK